MRRILFLSLFPVALLFVIKKPVYGICILIAFYLVAPQIWGLPLSIKPVYLFTALTATGWIIAVSKGKKVIITRELVLLLILFGLMLISANQAVVSKQASFSFLKDLFKLIIAAFLTINTIDSIKKLNIVIWSILCSALWMSKSMIIQGLHVEQRIDIVIGLGLGPNFVAMVMGMCIPLVIQKLNSASKIEKMASYVLLPYFIVTMIVTGSRAGFLSLLLIAALTSFRAKKKLKIICIAIIVAIASLTLAPDYYLERMESIVEYQEESSAVSRLELWNAGLMMWAAHPFWGIGPANFALLSPQYVEWRSARSHQGLQAHNMYIEILAEVGVQGLIVYLLFFVSLLWSLRSRREVGYDSDMDNMGIGFRDGILNYMLFAMFGPVLFRDIFFYYAGCASVFPQLINQVDEEEHENAPTID